MAFHNDLGKQGEDMAAEMLRRKRYRILERNWKYGNLEVDIIAQKGNEVVFVEVKTRSDDSFMTPEDAVDWNKQRHLTVAASHYLQQKHIELNPRFDIVAIILNASRQEIRHMEDAFAPVGPRRKRRFY